jgi:hypothetical protein
LLATVSTHLIVSRRIRQQNTNKTLWFWFNFANGVYNTKCQDEVTIIVGFTGWQLADVLHVME